MIQDRFARSVKLISAMAQERGCRNSKKHSPVPEFERISRMIIDGMVRSRSNDKRSVFKTIPAISKPLLQDALKHFPDTNPKLFSVEEGMLVVTFDLSDRERKALQNELTRAETRLAKNQTDAEAALEKSLEARAKKAGVRLID